MGSFIVIHNPNAGENRNLPDRFLRFKAIVGDRGRVLQSADPGEIQAMAEDLVAKHEIDILALCGGDGTLNRTLTAFIRAYDQTLPPAVLILRGGIENRIARAVGVFSPAEQLLANIIEKYSRGGGVTTAGLDMMKLSTPQEDRFGFLFGNGLVARALELCNADPTTGPKAPFRAIRKGLAAFVTRGPEYERLFRKIDLTVTIEGFKAPLSRFMAVLAGTIPRVGAGFEPLYRANRGDGRFQILASGLSAGQVIANLPRFYSGRRLRGSDHFDFLASEATIESNEPFRYMVDGELAETEKVRLSVGLQPTFVVQ